MGSTDKDVTLTLTDRFNELLKDLSGCSFESPPLYMEEYFRKAVKEWLKQAIETNQFDSMEEAVYVTAFIGKLEKRLE